MLLCEVGALMAHSFNLATRFNGVYDDDIENLLSLEFFKNTVVIFGIWDLA